MSDAKVLIEAILLLAIPFVPVGAGYALRRKFRAGDEPQTFAQKAARLAGSFLFWGGIAGVLFMIVVALNFKGKI